MKPFKYLEHSSDPNKPSKRLDITLQLKKIQVVQEQLLIATKVLEIEVIMRYSKL